MYKRTIFVSQCSDVFFLKMSFHVCIATSVSIQTNFKPELTSYPVHMIPLSHLSRFIINNFKLTITFVS